MGTLKTEEAYALKAKALELLNLMEPRRELSQRTQSDYEKKYEVLIKKKEIGGIWDAALDTKKASTYFARRAAILYISYLKLEASLKEIGQLTAMLKSEKLREERERIGVRGFDCYSDIAQVIQTLETVPKSGQLTNRIPRQSKRRVGKVSDNWRETLGSRMIKWKVQYLSAAVTGCRPIEMVRGQVEISVSGEELIAVIGGAKVTDYSGQPERILKWPLDHPAKLVRELVHLTREGGGRISVKITGNAQNPGAIFSNAIRDSAMRAFPQLTSSITCYSLRHALASDLKAAGFSKVQIAQALGHISTDTQNTYGHTNAARGVSLAPIDVGASREVVSGSQRPAPDFDELRERN